MVNELSFGMMDIILTGEFMDGIPQPGQGHSCKTLPTWTVGRGI